MLNYTLTFFVIALIASLLGFGEVAGLPIQVGWFFAVVAVVLFVVVFLNTRHRSRDALPRLRAR